MNKKILSKKLVVGLGMSVAMLVGSNAFAAQANVNQKGSLVVWPRIDVSPNFTTWIRLVNDGLSAVRVKCYYMNEAKARVDFEFDLTKNDPIIFDAATGDSPDGNGPGQAFPTASSNKGELLCWAVNDDGTALKQWNNLHGTATIVGPNPDYATEYNAWSFMARKADLGSGDLVLNGADYDSCPAYLFGQFSRAGSAGPGGSTFDSTKIQISSCKQDLRQDYNYNYTKLQFDVYRYDEVRFTGAYTCSNSWIESLLDQKNSKMTAGLNFNRPGVEYYRVQGVASTQCPGSAATGLIGLQTSVTVPGNVGNALSAELGASGSSATNGAAGFVKWDAFGGLTDKK